MKRISVMENEVLLKEILDDLKSELCEKRDAYANTITVDMSINDFRELWSEIRYYGELIKSTYLLIDYLIYERKRGN